MKLNYQELVIFTRELRKLADDHYWDSLSQDKGLIMKHLDSILRLALKDKKGVK